jgi:hypothetical protein
MELEREGKDRQVHFLACENVPKVLSGIASDPKATVASGSYGTNQWLPNYHRGLVFSTIR